MSSIPLPNVAAVPEVGSGRTRATHVAGGVAADEDASPAEACRASIARQFSLWPFGTRLLRLYLLADPSEFEGTLMRGLLRAMQQEYFRSEGRSQTNALRSTILAAHYVLRHRNRESLPQDWITAAAACAVTRGTTAYVALAGDAAALAWDGQTLQVQRHGGRATRPVGADHTPRVSFWSAPLAAGQRLALICGAAWTDEAVVAAEAILRVQPLATAEATLARAFTDSHGPARVIVADGSPGSPARTHQRQPHRGAGHRLTVRPAPIRREPPPLPDPASARARTAGPPAPRTPEATRPGSADATARRPSRARLRRSVVGVLALALVAVAAGLALGPFGEAQHVALAREAETLLEQAQRTRSPAEAYPLAASAYTFAQKAATASPGDHAALLARSSQTLRGIDRAYEVSPILLVRLGTAAASVVDLAVDDTALFALDVNAGAVQRFDSTRPEQTAISGAIVVQRGDSVGGTDVDVPVAIAYAPAEGAGVLTVVDRSRGVLQLSESQGLVRRAVAGGRDWQRIAALAGVGDSLYVLDGDAGRLLAYDGVSSGLRPPPRQVLDARTAPAVPFRTTVELVARQDFYFRDQDGTVKRFDRQGRRLPFDVRPPGAPLGPISGIASDGTDGLYLADPLNARVVHASGDGRFLRQLRAAAPQSLAGLRGLQLSADGRRLYTLASDGVLAFALPAEIPAPLELTADLGPASATPEPASTQVIK